jgi:hypothetical protein
MALSNFAQNYVIGKQVRLQQEQAAADREKQEQVNKLLGGVLMGGGGGEELAALDPQAFLGAQQYLQGQELKGREQQRKEEETALKVQKEQQDVIDEQRADFQDWEEESIERISGADEADRPAVYNFLMKQGAGRFDPSFLADMPAEWNEEVAGYINALGDKKPGELKTGRFKSIVAPNGDVYQMDTSTGERELMFKGVAPAVELKSGMEKRLVETQDAARKSRTKSREYEVLAQDFENENISGGMFSSAWEAAKEYTGQQDLESNMRRRWQGIKASEVVNNLPPGAASDKDIEMAMSGFPAANASAKQIAQFLRGMAKLESENAKYNGLEAAWIAENGNTAAANRDFTFEGVEIKKGQRLLDVYKGLSTEGIESQNKAKFPNAPDVGSETGGYKYTGGDPADPNNWEKL